MPLRHIDEANLDYYLVLFDGDGSERPEQDGSLLSKTMAQVVQDGITDVFFSSHGWKGDIPAAISQYNDWIGAMAAQVGDRDRARALDPDFKAMIIGVHWPSLPWGNEDAGAALLGDDEIDEFAVEQQRMDVGDGRTGPARAGRAAGTARRRLPAQCQRCAAHAGAPAVVLGHEAPRAPRR
jgi:hypothetical protein